MAQWFNRDFFANIHLVLKPDLVIPQEHLDGIWQVDARRLVDRGIRACVIDINQTLLAYDAEEEAS